MFHQERALSLHSQKYSYITVADLCLKYYRAPRYRVRCVTIVLVERKCNDFKSEITFETTYIYKDLRSYICVMFVYVRNCVRVARARTELRMC